MSTLELAPGVLTVDGALSSTERQADEEAFLAKVGQLVSQPGREVMIDLVRAGNLPSTLIALSIAAARIAKDKGKHLTVRVAKRNAIAVRVSGLAEIVDVQYL